MVFCENGSNVDSVFVNGEIVVESGRLTKVDEKEVLRRAEHARRRLEPSMQKELAAAQMMEPSAGGNVFSRVRTITVKRGGARESIERRDCFPNVSCARDHRPGEAQGCRIPERRCPKNVNRRYPWVGEGRAVGISRSRVPARGFSRFTQDQAGQGKADRRYDNRSGH